MKNYKIKEAILRDLLILKLTLTIEIWIKLFFSIENLSKEFLSMKIQNLYLNFKQLINLKSQGLPELDGAGLIYFTRVLK